MDGAVRGDINDRAAAALGAHDLGGFTRAQERPVQIGRLDTVPEFDGDILQPPLVLDRRVVDRKFIEPRAS